jgi:hypothetical protein
MIRKLGRVKGNVVELLEPGSLQDGALVELEIHPMSETEDWHNLGMSRLEEEWDNPENAIYDGWKRLYGVQEGYPNCVPVR